MHCNPPGGSHADRADFFVVDPHSRISIHAAPVHIKSSEDANHNFFQAAKVSMEVASVVIQVKDRVRDQLARTVVCDIASAVSQDKFGSGGRKLIVWQEEVARVSPSSQSIDGVMFSEEECIIDSSSRSPVEESVLEVPAFPVRCAAEGGHSNSVVPIRHVSSRTTSPPRVVFGGVIQILIASPYAAAAASIIASLRVGWAWTAWINLSPVVSSRFATTNSPMSSVASDPRICPPSSSP